jgi:hypothetical protein
MTNVEIAENLGILDDLHENYSDDTINNMEAKDLLGAWLEWEGIIGYTNRIVKIYESFKNKK